MSNMRITAFIVVALAIVAVASALDLKRSNHVSLPKGFTVQKPASLVDPGKPTWCSVCVDWMGQATNQIINIILNTGIPGDCQALCNQYPGTSFDQALCELYCDYKGINYFMNLLNNFNPDFIAICEGVDVCPRSKTSKAVIKTLKISPAKAAQGAKFDIDVVYDVTSQIGTGMIIVQINPPDAEPMQWSQTLVSLPVASYSVGLSVDTSQPSQDEPYDPGQYQVLVAICEGTCGSSGAYSYQLGFKQGEFTITQ